MEGSVPPRRDKEAKKIEKATEEKSTGTEETM